MSRALVFALFPVVLRQGQNLRRDIVRLEPPTDAWSGGDRSPSAPQLLIIGDSSAVGTGVESMTEALAGQIVRRLHAGDRRERAFGWRVVGSNGATSTQVLERHRAEILAEPADVAIVLVGWNDAMRLRSRSAYAHGLSALLHVLRDGNPGIQLIVVAPPAFGRFAVLPQPLRTAIGRHAHGLTRTAEHLAAEFDAGFTPGFDGASVASDRFHPDAAGYGALADGVIAALARMPAGGLGGHAAL